MLFTGCQALYAKQIAIGIISEDELILNFRKETE